MVQDQKELPLVIGVSGASGAILAIRILQMLKGKFPLHLVMTKAGERTLIEETDMTPKDFKGLADVVYPNSDIGAAIASGTYKVRGMMVVPCSIRTMSAIAYGLSDDLLSRAADTQLKERRPLLLAVREVPFHLGHTRALTQLNEMGAIIAPPQPVFYARPKNMEEMIDQMVSRMLDLMGIETDALFRWQG